MTANNTSASRRIQWSRSGTTNTTEDYERIVADIGALDRVAAERHHTSGSPDQARNHNYYFYQESPHKFSIIPRDLESTLSLYSNFGNVPYWQTVPTDCSLQYLVWGGPNPDLLTYPPREMSGFRGRKAAAG
jgi:hypothetical protein